MNNSERDFLRKLEKAKTEDEKTWLTTKRLIDSLPYDLQTLVYSAAIPHWFDAKTLRALHPELSRKIRWIYPKLQKLPFVEPFEGRGHNIHELTRRLILDYLWKKQKRTYLSLSRNLVEFYENSMNLAQKKISPKIKELEKRKFTKKSIKEFQQWVKKNQEIVNAVSVNYQIEHIYHLVIAQPKRGADWIQSTGWKWHNELDYSFVELNALINSLNEHISTNRITGRALGWATFFKGLLALYQFGYENAKTLFLEVLSKYYSDKKLNASALFRLGQLHSQSSEPAEARARFEEALSLYHVMNDKLGEANCFQALGDVHRRLSELPEARARFEEALSLYHVMNDKLGEANCIKSLGSVHLQLSELSEARARYEEASLLYHAIGNKLSEAKILRTLGDVLNRLSKLPEEHTSYKEAEAVYRKAIELDVSDITTYSALGSLLDELKRYDEAEAIYRKAIEHNPTEVEALYHLGRHLADENVKKYDDAEKIFLKILKLNSNHKDTLYCLACIKSLNQDTDTSFSYLQAAVANGFDRNWAWKDPDLEWLRDDPRFIEIVGTKPE